VLAGAALWLAVALPVAADDAQQLKALRHRLERLQTELNETQGKRDAVREELRTLDARIGAARRALRALDTRLTAYQRQLKELRARQRDEQRLLALQRAALARQLRAAHAIGDAEPVKLVLNQDDPARVARVMTYYRLLNQARIERLSAIRAGLDRLQALDARLQVQTRGLEAARAEQERERHTFETARARRGELLASLNLEVRDRSQEIERLRADEQRLERLVGELKSALLPFVHPDPQARFASLKGRLPLPVAGRILAGFGNEKGVGNLRWRGAFLAAREGQEVRAVHGGRVVYADWLRGFGLLLILEHGDGYMTLYGHNQSLYREVGEWVDAGQVVAAAGSTGDATQSGVYFEIRHDGEPQDPLRWCVARTPPNTVGRRKPNR
jgi:septal ring factor EnvC (AmiA/AmiB activator)